ncbi:MAG: thioredoxin family protein [Deltaproteobacteria bacterium]|nr:MAG: thioredoxin family protein [Deltaproteobacteria bacterium]
MRGACMPRLYTSPLALGMLLLACSAEAEPPPTSQAPATSATSTDPPPVAPGPAVQVGEVAPDFVLPDTTGALHRLSEHRGRTVVLEWFNPGCPFVKYAYGEGLLPDLRRRWIDAGVDWLTINSSAPDRQGHGAEVNDRARQRWQMDLPVLLDETGAVGRRFGVTTTPQFVVIDPDGIVRHVGALDNAPLGLVDDGGRVDYIDRALQQLARGEPVDPDRTKPYGCSVKYAG